jgi:DNA-binding transcriptional ArsR family regulator
LFAALGDETRLRIVERLVAGGPLSIAQITTGEHVTRQAITKHLLVLESAGLVKGSRRGRERLWQLDAQQLEAARRYLDHVSKQWDEALERLREHVER